MNPIIVYTSKYGATEAYAQWLAEALQCPAKRLREVRPGELDTYDTILYGGGLYVGKVAGFKAFLQKLGPAGDKRLALLMVGMTNPAEAAIYMDTAKQNIPPEWAGRCEAFALHGGITFSKMGPLHRLMMRMPRAMAAKKPEAERTAEDRQLVEHFGEDALFATREQLGPVLAWARQG